MPRRASSRHLAARLIPAALLAAAIAAVLVIAFGQIDAGATSSARTEREVVSASDGVVQSTVTGTGNVEPVTEEDVDFQTSGTLRAIDVKDGEYVHQGQLLATLKNGTASLTLAQARATLAQARVTLTDDEKTYDDTSDSSSSSDTSAAVTDSAAVTEDVDDALTATTTTTTTARPMTTTTTTAASPTTATTATTTGATGSSSSTGSSGSSSTSGSSSDVTAATIDSDKLAIVDDEQTVSEDRADLAETRLTAPVSGTITSLESLTPGASISSGSDSSSSDASSSDATSSTAAGGSSATAATGASTSASTTSTEFAEIDSLRHLSMTVSFTEADISELKVGESATVSFDALSDVELAGRVTSVSSLGTTDDDVVSYDATITLDQDDSQVKPGMSASAAVIVKQGHGVTVPSTAVTGTGTLATVSEQVDGKDTTHKVIVGLRGSSRDLIVSGLKSGAELVETETLPATGSSTKSSSAATGATSGLGTGGGRAFGGGGAGGFGGGAGGPP